MGLPLQLVYVQFPDDLPGGLLGAAHDLHVPVLGGAEHPEQSVARLAQAVEIPLGGEHIQVDQPVHLAQHATVVPPVLPQDVVAADALCHLGDGPEPGFAQHPVGRADGCLHGPDGVPDRSQLTGAHFCQRGVPHGLQLGQIVQQVGVHNEGIVRSLLCEGCIRLAQRPKCLGALGGPAVSALPAAAG